MSRALRTALLALLTTACSGGAAETTPTSSLSPSPAPAPSPSPTPAPSRAPVRITLPACGYGGSATAVAVFVDVETDVALHGVAFSFAIADPATHAALGHSREPIATVISPVERGLLDFSTQGTTPFDGELAPGARTRLQHYAGVDDLPPGIGGPIEVQLVMTTTDGQRLEATCTTDQMWPSS